MVRKPAKENAMDSVFHDLSHKVRLALGTLISDNPLLFVAPSDVAEKLLAGYPSLRLDARAEMFRRTSAVLSSLYKSGNHNIVRTEHKITPKGVGRNAQYGYRIGAAIAPLRTTEVRLTEKMTAQAAVAAAEDPVEFIRSIRGQIPLLKLNALIVELISELQDRVLANHMQMVELDKKLTDLSQSFNALNNK